MKKYFLTAILSLLVATVFTSCGDNDIIEETEPNFNAKNFFQ